MQPTPKSPSSTPRFAADTCLADVLDATPAARAILMRFHIGGCHHCGFDPKDTIQKVAEDNGIPTESLLAALNGA